MKHTALSVNGKDKVDLPILIEGSDLKSQKSESLKDIEEVAGEIKWAIKKKSMELAPKPQPPKKGRPVPGTGKPAGGRAGTKAGAAKKVPRP